MAAITIYVNVKTLGKRKDAVKPVPFVLPAPPDTAQKLIAMLARLCAANYNRRLEEPVQALSENALAEMTELGKVAFGMLTRGAAVEVEAAAETAVQAYRDGIVRLYIGGTEPSEPDGPISLGEGDTVTLLRLVMLTGSWL